MSRSISWLGLPAVAATLSLLCAGCDDSSPEDVVEPIGTGIDAGNAGAEAGAAAPETGTAAPDASRQDATPGTQQDAAPVARDAASAEASSGDAATANAEAGSSEAGSSEAGSSEAGSGLDVASGLNGLFLDVLCAPNTPTPLANGATCLHPGTTQHMEKVVTLGGASGSVYAIKLRVRGIWEPTKIDGGERPDKAHPLTVGGMLPAGTGSSDAVSYQQYSIQVSEPKQTYWLNDHQYLAHDIKKEDYMATLRVAGGAKVTVIMNDGNERQIANWPKSYFTDLPPYDKTPSLGQLLRLDVVSVELAP
jgi:hypothetical protein